MTTVDPNNLKTLIILNPNAKSGTAGEIFSRIEPKLPELLGPYKLAVTETAEELNGHLDQAITEGIERIIAVGGDGTNNTVINALVERPNLHAVFGSIPIGTGRDWGRMLGIPKDPLKALAWLKSATPVYCDVGEVKYQDTRLNDEPVTRLFLNVASAGISGEVDARVNRAKRRNKLTFVLASMKALLQYKPQNIKVTCDGKLFYEGLTYLLVVANGRAFGRGMWIAPDAYINDGKFDIVLVEGVSKWHAMQKFPSLFRGKHINQRYVHQTRTTTINVENLGSPLSMDLDGEEAHSQNLLFTIIPKAVQILLDPEAATVIK